MLTLKSLFKKWQLHFTQYFYFTPWWLFRTCTSTKFIFSNPAHFRSSFQGDKVGADSATSSSLPNAKLQDSVRFSFVAHTSHICIGSIMSPSFLLFPSHQLPWSGLLLPFNNLLRDSEVCSLSALQWLILPLAWFGYCSSLRKHKQILTEERLKSICLSIASLVTQDMEKVEDLVIKTWIQEHMALVGILIAYLPVGWSWI